MSITINKLDGTTEVVEPRPGTCKEAIIAIGVVQAPPDTFQVITPEDQKNVDNQPFADFDSKKLAILPKKGVGGYPTPF